MPESVPNAIFTPAFTALAKFSRCASFVISVFRITSSEYPSRGPSWIIQSPSNMSATRYVPRSTIRSIVSSSMRHPCSIERTPARIARFAPSAPCACAATCVPLASASSTAARISSSVSSGSPGFVPDVRTAPVAITLMKSAPASKIRRTFARTWSGPVETPTRSSLGTGTSGGETGDVAAAAGAGHVRAGAHHPGPGDPAVLDRLAEREVDERVERPHVADGGEAAEQRGARVRHPGEGLLRGRSGSRGRRSPARRPSRRSGGRDSRSSRAGRSGPTGRSCDPVGPHRRGTTSRMRSPSSTSGPVGEHVAGRHVDETAGDHNERLGRWHRRSILSASPSRGTPIDLRPVRGSMPGVPIPRNMVRRKHHASIVAAAALVILASLLGAVSLPAAAAAPTWFDLPTSDSFPQGLAAGPDGMTWVANRAAAEIERVAPDGSTSPIALESGADPFDIVRGPDGAMWFTEHNGNRIGRLTADGELSEFYLRDLSTPTGHHGRPRRRPLVRAAGRQRDRPHHPRRGAHRVADDHPSGAHRSASRPAPTGPCGSP